MILRKRTEEVGKGIADASRVREAVVEASAPRAADLDDRRAPGSSTGFDANWEGQAPGECSDGADNDRAYDDGADNDRANDRGDNYDGGVSDDY